MKDFTATFHVDASPATVFDTMVDPEFGSGRFMKMEVVEQTEDWVGSRFRYWYEVLGFRFGGGSYVFSEYVPDQRLKMDFSGGGVAAWLAGGPVSGTWTLAPSEGGTDLTVHPEFTDRIPVVNGLVRRALLWSWHARDFPRYKAEIEKRARAGAA